MAYTDDMNFRAYDRTIGSFQDIAEETLVIAVGESEQFGNTLFEHVALVVIDSVVLALMRDLDDPTTLMERNHTNLE